MSRVRRLVTFSAGAAAMYFLDPERGRGRRAQAGAKLGAKWRRVRQEAERERRYAEGVAEGRKHDRPSHRPADDQALVDRVKSQLGPVLPLDRINLSAVDGVVELRGELSDAAGVVAVVEAVRGVAGVKGVTNLLHLPGTPAPTRTAALRSTS